jgi:transcription initiation factor TFIIIB Brf1 subunit/transcription initiation factor TFIIB
MSEKRKCPECGHKEFKYDERTKEVYCKRCGLIIEDFSSIADSNEWETSHEPLSDGLALKSEMAKIEREHNFKSSSKHKYENIKQRYYDLLETELLEMDFKLGEIEEVFNYCFMPYYLNVINSNAPIVLDNGKKKQLTHTEVIKQFLNSYSFDSFDVRSSVSKFSLGDSVETLGYVDNLDVRTVNRILGKQNYKYNKKRVKNMKSSKKNGKKK